MSMTTLLAVVALKEWRLLTGSILAHELMHGWLRLKGYRNLSPEVGEGICQDLSHLWLESETPDLKNMPSSSSSVPSSSYVSASSKKGRTLEMEKKLGEFFKYQIQHDTSSAYGDCFITAYAAVSKYGLRHVLDHIRFTGKFPI
ncbi:hypothetical protein LUZ60_012918 [Juncus effusus]|nr:hypothetical protein LUZ60_012918 [Juncus effusus]